MLKSINWPYYIKNGAIAALFYVLAVVIFIIQSDYRSSWILFVGNFMFMAAIGVFLIRYNKYKNENPNALAMAIAGHLTVVLGVIISCLLCFIAASVLIPGLYDAGQADKVLERAPDNNIEDNKTHGMLPMILLNAVVANFGTGAFIALLFPFTLKADQTSEVVSPKQAEF